MSGKNSYLAILVDGKEKLVDKHAIRRILIRGPNWIGDAVMSEPAISSVSRLFPRIEVTLLVKPAIAELFAHHPAVHRRIVYEQDGRHAGLSGKWRLAGELRRHRFDLAILLQNAFEAALLGMLAGVSRRYGYATDGRGLLLTDPVRVPAGEAPCHQVEYYWQLIKGLGAEGHPPAPRLYVTRQEELAMAQRLTEAGIAASDFLIGLNPGSTYGSAKRWLPDRYADVVNRLCEHYERHGRTRVAVVILGAKGEEPLGRAIADRIRPNSFVCSGRTTIRELMALVKRCRLFLTNDTGPMHVAAAFDVPTVAVFGPTDSRTTAPFGGSFRIVKHEVACAPCLLRDCPIDHRCMTAVTVDEVYDAAREQTAVGAGPKEPLSRPKREAEAAASGPLAGVTVFLDRDGTLNHDPGFVKTPDELQLLPGVSAALARLQRAGAMLIVLTNQSGVGRGLFSLRDLDSIHGRLRELLAGDRVQLDAIYTCPHHPDENCTCRKPRPGLVEQALAEHAIDLSRSYVIGDQPRDIELAHRVGAKSVLVTTGPAGRRPLVDLELKGFPPDRTAASLADAAEWIFSDAAAAGRKVSSISLAPRDG